VALTLRCLRRIAAGRTVNDWEGHVGARLAAMPDDATPLQRAQLLEALSVGSELIRLRQLTRELDLGAEFDPVLASVAQGDSAGAGAHLAWLDAALAARTKRVNVGSFVILGPFYHPLRLAEDAALIDVISGGRLRLGRSSLRTGPIESLRLHRHLSEPGDADHQGVVPPQLARHGRRAGGRDLHGVAELHRDHATGGRPLRHGRVPVHAGEDSPLRPRPPRDGCAGPGAARPPAARPHVRRTRRPVAPTGAAIAPRSPAPPGSATSCALAKSPAVLSPTSSARPASCRVEAVTSDAEAERPSTSTAIGSWV